MKKCNNCFQEKPSSEFYPKRDNKKTGLQSRCKKCHTEVARGYRQRKRDADAGLYVPSYLKKDAR